MNFLNLLSKKNIYSQLMYPDLLLAWSLLSSM